MRRLIWIAATVAAGFASGAHAQNTSPAIDWTVQAEDAPESTPWTEPASIGFKSVEGGEESWNVAVAVRAELGRAFASAAVIRKTGSSDQQEHYAVKVGVNFDHWIPMPAGRELDETMLYIDPSIGLTRTTSFAEEDATACAAVPAPATCRDQRDTSVRAELKVQVFRPGWSSAPQWDDDAQSWRTDDEDFFFDWSPTFMLFHDQIIDAKADATGVRREGSVSGLQSSISGALTPKFWDYRVVLRGNARHLATFDRSDARRAVFPSDAFVWSASINYEWGVRSFEAGRTGWSPSVGLTYTSGDDPLTGRKDVSDWAILLKLSLRS
jgi:hypothetical protein